jgi:Holliday junction resolvasome RuvABC endonuclease subunit
VGMPHPRLLAIDPSLTCSGWALFETPGDGLLAVGKVRALGAELPLAHRLEDLQRKILRIFDDLKIGAGDWVVCEAPTTMRDPRAAIKVEQVRGIFEVLARGRQARVPGRINPRTVHFEVLGLRGKQLPRAEIKRMAVEVAARLFADSLSRLGFEPKIANLAKHQDIVDALLLGHLALTRLRAASWADTSLEEVLHRRALRRVG